MEVVSIVTGIMVVIISPAAITIASVILVLGIVAETAKTLSAIFTIEMKLVFTVIPVIVTVKPILAVVRSVIIPSVMAVASLVMSVHFGPILPVLLFLKRIMISIRKVTLLLIA